MSSKPGTAKATKRRPVSQHFNLSQIESLQLRFNDQQGTEVLVVELDRTVEEKPQLKISTGFSESGDLKSQFVIYDINA